MSPHTFSSQAYADYKDIMELTEDIIVNVAEVVNQSTTVDYQVGGPKLSNRSAVYRDVC